MTPFASLMSRLEVREVSPGTVILEEGRPSDGLMYALLSGEVRIVRGGVVLEHLKGEGGIFGELALIDDKPRFATAIAVVPSRMVAISQMQFRELTLRNPSFALEMMRLLAGRLRAYVSS